MCLIKKSTERVAVSKKTAQITEIIFQFLKA